MAVVTCKALIAGDLRVWLVLICTLKNHACRCFDLDADDKRGVTKQFYGISNGFHESGVVVGAIACAFIGGVCVHVGLVVMADGRIRILETDTPHGVSCTPIAIFEGRYTAVKYYDN